MINNHKQVTISYESLTVSYILEAMVATIHVFFSYDHFTLHFSFTDTVFNRKYNGVTDGNAMFCDNIK